MGRQLASSGSNAENLEANYAPKERPMTTNSQEIWIIPVQFVTLHFVPTDRSKAIGDEYLNASLGVKEVIAPKLNCSQIVKQIDFRGWLIVEIVTNRRREFRK